MAFIYPFLVQILGEHKACRPWHFVAMLHCLAFRFIHSSCKVRDLSGDQNDIGGQSIARISAMYVVEVITMCVCECLVVGIRHLKPLSCLARNICSSKPPIESQSKPSSIRNRIRSGTYGLGLINAFHQRPRSRGLE